MRLEGILLAMCLSLPQDASPRAARSVHLGWDAPEGIEFSNEVHVDESVPGSYFMACGWNTGYFGIQELAGSKEPRKIVLFSVWDPAKGDDAARVPLEDRVQVVDHDPDARIGRFGGEGTGAQCKFPYSWALGERCRFLVRAVAEGQMTSYAGWFYRNDANKWIKLATFRVRTGGAPLRGYYSFVEDFRRDGKSAGERRLARFGPGWIRSTLKDWIPLTRARFTADSTKLDSIDTTPTESGFALATGGTTKNHARLDSILTLPRFEAKLPDDFPAP